jgi:hypothetical protein
VGRIMVERASSHNCPDVDAFAKEIGKLVAKVHESELILSQLRLGDVLSDVFKQLRRYQVSGAFVYCL